MQSIRKPLWVLLVLTLPQAAILCVLGKIFTVIRPLLEPQQINGWAYFGVVLVIALVFSSVYAALCFVRKKEIVRWFGIAVFLVYIPVLYAAIVLRVDLVPSTVPGWMMFNLEPIVVLEALTVPAFAYAMLLTVYWFTPEKGETKMARDAVWTISIPVGWYVFFVVIIPYLRTGEEIIGHALLVLFVISTAVFLFFLTRMAYIFLQRKPDIWKKLIIPVVLVFPLAGLALNISIGGPFGNFSHPGFFIAAIACGVLLILPEKDTPVLRLLTFLGKMLLLPYTIYFFIVFLPYLPLSIPAIIGFGTGFLIMAPTLLFLVHIRSLNIDWNYLQQHYTKSKIVLPGILMTLLIPLTITGWNILDKVNLDKAFTVAVTPSYSESTPVRVNRNGVRRVLSNVTINSRRDGTILPVFTQQTPLLSAWYRFLVMDNLTLSEDKANLIRQVILGESTASASNTERAEPRVKLMDVGVESTYDDEERLWRSWVNLTLENQSNWSMAEYITSFTLPEGSYISNYYLYVGEEKKFGLLADKRAAEWIYRQVTTYRQDPGLLRYIGSNQLELRVFPFSTFETRRTGFELIHKEPVTLVLEGKTLELKGDVLNEPVVIENAVYLSASAKKTLNRVTRENEWLILFDSTDKVKLDHYFESVKTFIRKQKLDTGNMEFVAVNDNLWKVFYENDGFTLQKGAAHGGGFYADKAIKTILAGNAVGQKATRPIIVMVTDDISNALIQNDYDLWKAALPEGDQIYHLDSSGELTTYHLEAFNTQNGERVERISSVPVLVWPDEQSPEAYIADDGNASIVLTHFGETATQNMNSSTGWEMGVLQQAEYFNTVLHSEMKREKQFSLVRSSIATGVLSPFTAYIVLENEAQENMLREKQKQILSAGSELDLGEPLPEPSEMNEPGLLIVAVLFAGILVIKAKRNIKN